MFNEQEILKEIIRENLNKEVLSITPVLEKGIVNKIYILDLAEDKKVVIRLNHSDSFDQFKKEQWCIEQSADKNVPSPKVLGLGFKEDLVYMILSFIDGSHPDNLQQYKIWKLLGRYAATVHQIQTAGFGDHMVKPGFFNGSWDNFLDYNISSLTKTDILIKDGILTNDESAKIKKLFEELKNKKFRFALNHGDISLKNCLVDNQDQVYLIDWGSAESHIIPHFDLIEIIKASFNLAINNPNFKAFLKGYGISGLELKSLLPEIKTLMILRAIDKLRWGMERKPEKIEHFKSNLLEIKNFVL